MTEKIEPSPRERLDGAVMFSMPLPPEMAAWALGRIQGLEGRVRVLEASLANRRAQVKKLEAIVESLKEAVDRMDRDTW